MAEPLRARSRRPAVDNPVEDPVTTKTEPASNAEAKSEAQLLLDRMLAQCNRFNRITRRLLEVRGSIAAPQPVQPPVRAGAAPAPATSFFEALHMLADGNDQVADELERSVEDLGALF